jgi:hypothetical protein
MNFVDHICDAADRPRLWGLGVPSIRAPVSPPRMKALPS